jgi:serine/threonine-protein kinase RsbW
MRFTAGHDRDALTSMGDDQLDSCVDVVVPLSPRHASTLRLMTASLGTDAGFSLDEIDDLKLALSEAFSMLLIGARTDRARATFTTRAGALKVVIGLESGDDLAIEPDDLGLKIMTAVVDAYDITKSSITLWKGALELPALSVDDVALVT